jgi:hypothetical protein
MEQAMFDHAYTLCEWCDMYFLELVRSCLLYIIIWRVPRALLLLSHYTH